MLVYPELTAAGLTDVIRSCKFFLKRVTTFSALLRILRHKLGSSGNHFCDLLHVALYMHYCFVVHNLISLFLTC